MSEPTTDRDAWSRDPETLERIFHAALKQGDAKGVEGCLRLLAVCDPYRAQDLYDSLRLGLALAGER